MLERPSAGERSSGSRGVAPDRGRPRHGENAQPPHMLDDEEKALEGLGEEERRLDQQIEQVRQEAETIVARAREEAIRRGEAAAVELVEQVERLRQQRRRELEQTLGSIREDGERQVESVRRRADSNRERALAWLLSKVAGGDEP